MRKQKLKLKVLPRAKGILGLSSASLPFTESSQVFVCPVLTTVPWVLSLFAYLGLLSGNLLKGS